MATLHISGKAKKAMNYADASMPMYMLFSTQADAESSSLVINTNNLVGAARVTKREILGPVVDGQLTVSYGDKNYKVLTGSISDISTGNVTSVYFEAPLTTDSVAAQTNVIYIILVSHLQGISVTASNVSATNIRAAGVNYIIEAVHRSSGITVTSSVSKTVGMIIDV